MNFKSPVLLALLGAVYFTLLFDKQSIGLNLLLFELPVLGFIAYSNRQLFPNLNFLLLWIGTLVSVAFVALHNTTLSIVVNFVYLFLLMGFLIYPATKSLVTSIELGFTNVFMAQFEFIEHIGSSKVRGFSVNRFFRILKIALFPLFIITVFLVLYSLSNPIFDSLLGRAFTRFFDYLERLFRHISFVTVLVFLLGLFISIFLIFKYASKMILKNEQESTDQLTRKKTGNQYFGTVSLKNEYKAGVFLLLCLNAILLVVNVIDVRWVWFTFEWNGGYLKQFIREGTYLLIISILLAVAVILFFFRGNLNFYMHNKLLRSLAIFWMVQNAILAISVCLRNVHYIEYFALAYKRIGVFIFLFLLLIGIATIIRKVQKQKTFYWVTRVNFLALLITLFVVSWIDWDKVIVRYNFNHYQTAFVHYDFLVTLPDRCLPLLDKSEAELAEIKTYQDKQFKLEHIYMNPSQYREVIRRRKDAFIAEFERRPLLSRNLADYRAYQKLKNQQAATTTQ